MFQDTSSVSSHHQHKSSKSNSGINNINNSGLNKSPSPSHLDHNSVAFPVPSKNSGQNLVNYSSSSSSSSPSSSNNYSKGNNINNSSNNNNNSNSVNSHHKMPNLSSTLTESIDLVSPTKKSTDHSISSIISPPPPTTLLSSSANNKTSSSPSSLNTETATTHIITVDNLKSTSEIINTTNKLLNNSNNVNNGNDNSKNSNSSSAKANSKGGPIRIRSFANVSDGKTQENDQIKELTTSNSGSIKSENKIEEDSSSESDGVEIVGVYPASTKKQNISSGLTTTSTTKTSNNGKQHKRSSKISSRSNSPIDGYTAIENKITTKTSSLVDTVKESDLDVNQIMKALKELEVSR